MIRPNRPGVLLTMAGGVLIATVGCPKKSSDQGVETRPAGATSQPANLPPETSQPADTPPVSTYDSKPPYPVKLYVRDPNENQPGWLRILALADETSLATADGSFPEKNRIYVNTNNVRQLQIHIGHLPLAAKTRTILRIDEQGIQITRTDREFIILTRSPAGVWNIATPDGSEK